MKHAEYTTEFIAKSLESTSLFQNLYTNERCNQKMTIKQNPMLSEMVNEVKKEAERLLQKEPPQLTEALYSMFQHTGNRLSFERVYFEQRRRLTSFSILAYLDIDKERFIEALTDTIRAIHLEPTWCLPAHMIDEDIATNIDLFAAETAFSLSEIAALLADDIPSALIEQIYEEVNRRIFVPFIQHRIYGWETAEHNWAAVCAGSVGAAALLLPTSNELNTTVIKRVLSSIRYYLNGFGEDGACLEGLGYWNYGFGYYVYFADILRIASNGRINLFDDPMVHSIAQFQHAAYLSGNRVVNFSDAVPTSNIQVGLSDYLSREFNLSYTPAQYRTQFTDDHCSRFAPAIRNLLWFSAEAERETDWHEGSYYFPQAAWFVSRIKSNFGGVGFAAKGGHNDEPHNHIDLGQFILLLENEPAFIADLGSGEYTADYFNKHRYEYACTSADGHSVPRINGLKQQAGYQYKATVIEATRNPDEDRFIVDLTNAYPEGAAQLFTRAFYMTKALQPELQLIDTFSFEYEPESLQESFITKCKVTLHQLGELHLNGDKYKMSLFYNPDHFKYEIEELIFSNHYGEQEPYTRINFIYMKRPVEHIGKKTEVQLTCTFRFTLNQKGA